MFDSLRYDFKSCVNILVIFIAFGPFAYSKDDKNFLMARKWCAWSSWTTCSPIECQQGIKRYLSISENDDDGDDDDEKQTYCVLPVDKKSRLVRKAYVQITSGDNVRRVVPEKQRYRKCQCRTISLLNVFIFPDQCVHGDTMFECAECTSAERIYYTRDAITANLIPYCSAEKSGLKLYKIIGGILGSIAIICLLVCLIRTFVKHLWLTKHPTERTSEHLTTTGSRHLHQTPIINLSNTNCPVDGDRREYRFMDPDQPPTYTDVVSLPKDTINVTSNPVNFIQDYNNTTINNDRDGLRAIPSTRIIRPQTHRFACTLYDPNLPIHTTNNNTATCPVSPPSTTTTNDQYNVPPPSYEEIMHQTNMNVRNISKSDRSKQQPQQQQQPVVNVPLTIQESSSQCDVMSHDADNEDRSLQTNQRNN